MRPNFILPYESASTAHRDAERRRQETKAWLAQREQAAEPPLTAPEREPAKETA